MSQLGHGLNEPTGSDGEELSRSDSLRAADKKPGEKKRASRAGSRNVSTLSPAQLARKRANDREAQRNIRLRTKEHIERLEARVEQLISGSQNEAELEEFRRRNEALELEVRQLSEALAQPRDDDSSGPDQPNESTFPNNAEISSPSTQNIPQGAPTTGFMNSHDFEAPWYHPATSINSIHTHRHPSGAVFEPIDGVSQEPASVSSLDGDSHFQCFGPNPSANLNDTGNWIPTSLPSDAVQSTNLAAISGHAQPQLTLQQTPSSAIIVAPSQAIPPHLPPFDALQPWALPILNTSSPTCGVDTLLLNIIRTQKEIARQGASESDIIGPPQPSMKALIYPNDQNQTHLISTMISRLLTNLTIKGLAERAGCLYLMYHICQWQIYPSSSTYGNLTDWTSPRTSQLITPHPVWVDSIFWGKLKDRVIEKQELYANEEFQNAYIICINVNWPRPDLEAFRFEGNDIFITEEFENHIKTLSNWSLDERFAARYPELAPLARISGVGGVGQLGLQGPYV
ncbi:686738bb-7a85-42da-8403-1e22c324256e [Sclerotinia trifoliorum]|uniref:686738bb-7a85-42da-8403-1e22c324256e n=1 Tax=Sclerotinia trifoliorum TaxID=28548 RepID=A0A8H2VUU5_9HELO|nr:686738bb-7a85-42da-8403-1e22c324256e [Sclerotinia trifoliorum]